MQFTRTHAAIIALIVANIIWGATSPILKWSLADIGPFTLAFLRFFIASILLLPFAIHKLKIQRKHILFLIFLAFIGFNIHIGAFLWGIKLAPSINAPIIGSAAPIFIIIGSVAFLREKVKRKTIIGTVISLLGVILIVIRPLLEENGTGMLAGNLLLVLGTITVVIYTLMLKKIDSFYSSLTITFWTFTIAAILFLPPVLWETQGNLSSLLSISPRGMIGVFYGAVLSSLVGYLLFTFSLKKIPASEAGVSFYLDPVIAILIAIPLLGEAITPAYILGSILVFAGIYIAEGKINYHPIRKIRRALEKADI